MNRRKTLAAAACVALSWLSRPAFADVAAAEALFEDGRRLLAAGDIAEACAKFGESERLDAVAGTMLNLAHCHELQHETATAWAEFLVAKRLANAEHRDAVAAEAARQAEQLSAELSYLTVTVAEAPPGLSLERDGEPFDIAALGTKIPADPGHHTLRATAPGYRPWTADVEIGPAHDEQRVDVPRLTRDTEVGLAPAPAPAAPLSSLRPRPSGATRATSSSSMVAPIIVGSAGVAFAGVGLAFGLAANGAYGDASHLCPSRKNCTPEAMSRRGDAERDATIANVSVAMGLTGVAIAVALYLVHRGSEHATAQTLTFAPSMVPGGAIVGSF